MKQFEYLTDDDIRNMFTAKKSEYSFSQFLNYLGGLGWEIDKQMACYSSGSPVIEYFAKREKIVPQQQSVNTGKHRVVAAPAGYMQL